MKKLKKKKVTKNKLSLYIIIGSALILGILFYLRQNSLLLQPSNIMEIKNNTGDIVLSLTPANSELNLNQDTTLSLLVDTKGAKVSAVQVELTYDQSQLEISDIKPSDFLPVELLKPKNENELVKFVYAVPPESGGKAGTGTVATLKVKAKKTGTHQLSYTPNTMAAAIGYNGNVLRQATDATIQVKSSTTTNTPTPTPTPQTQVKTPTPRPTSKSTKLSSPSPIANPSFLPEQDYNYVVSTPIPSTPTYSTPSPSTTTNTSDSSLFARFIAWIRAIFG